MDRTTMAAWLQALTGRALFKNMNDTVLNKTGITRNSVQNNWYSDDQDKAITVLSDYIISLEQRIKTLEGK